MGYLPDLNTRLRALQQAGANQRGASQPLCADDFLGAASPPAASYAELARLEPTEGVGMQQLSALPRRLEGGTPLQLPLPSHPSLVADAGRLGGRGGGGDDDSAESPPSGGGGRDSGYRDARGSGAESGQLGGAGAEAPHDPPPPDPSTPPRQQRHYAYPVGVPLPMLARPRNEL